jgi:CRP/FNR family transcriptional regulator, anaerobic regulatory protein
LLYYIQSGESCVISINSCFKNAKSSVKALVEEETELILIPVQKAQYLVKKYPQWNEFTYTLYNSKYLDLINIVGILTFSNKETRLIEYLKKKKAFSKSSILKVTHQEVANDLGSTREVISRLLKKLEHEGQVKLGLGFIEVL